MSDCPPGEEDWSIADDAQAAPADALPLEAGDESEIPLASAIRFCGRCGAAWQPGWIHCDACIASAIAKVEQANFEADVAKQPGIRPAITLYFAALATSLVAMIAIMNGAAPINVELTATAVLSAIVIVWCIVSGRGTLAAMFKPAEPKWFVVAVLTALFTCGIAFGVIEMLHRYLGLEKLLYSRAFYEAGHGTWLVVLVVCVQPAIFEELAFRGVILSSLRRALSDKEAVLVSAMLFMTIHLSFAAFPHTLAMGIAAGVLRLRTGSLLPGMLLHFVHNSIVIAAEMKYGI